MGAQEVDQVAVAAGVEHGDEQRRVAGAVGRIDLGPGVQEAPGGVERALLRREVERGEPLPVAEVRAVAGGDPGSKSKMNVTYDA